MKEKQSDGSSASAHSDADRSTVAEECVRKRVALYGGSFDPPHYGHILTITHLLNSDWVDEVWLVPAGDGRYDKKPIAAAAQRKNMLELAVLQEFPDDSRVHIETLQLEGPLKESATFDLLEACSAAHPQCEFLFVIGADNVEQLPTWRSASLLLRKYRFLLVMRGGEAAPLQLPDYILRVEQSERSSCNFSSSELRELIKIGAVVAGLLPANVRRYIEKENLYR